MMGNKIKLLLIEDSIQDARIFNERLISSHLDEFDLSLCTSLYSGVEKLLKEKFDVVVTDLTLPDSYGLNTFLEVKKYAGGIPVIINSGLNDQGLTMEAIRSGAQDYIKKSGDEGESIYQAILFAIERKKLTAEIEKTKNLLQLQTKELRKLNSELFNLNLDKDRFYSIVSHDLLNPFNTLLSFSDLLNDSYNEFNEEERKDYIQRINSQAKKILTLVKNLLQWTALNSGRMEYKPKLINLDKLLSEMNDFYQFSAISKNIKLTFMPFAEVFINADKFMVETIFRNLITNAIKFTPAGGEVIVRLMLKNESVVVDIEDTGVGMSTDDIQRLFNMEEIKSKPGTYLETGTGLGLMLCRELISKNNGSIDVRSELTKGTTFIISFPVTNGEAGKE